MQRPKKTKLFKVRVATCWGLWLEDLLEKAYTVVSGKHEIENQNVSIMLAVFGKGFYREYDIKSKIENFLFDCSGKIWRL